MRFDLDKTFGIHQDAVQLRSRRAELLAGNIANADTPNYKARDIDFKTALQQAQQGNANSNRLVTTNPRHIQADESMGNGAAEVMYRIPMQASVDGNTVDSQMEKTAFTQNAIEYQVSLQFLSGKIKNLKAALKGE